MGKFASLFKILLICAKRENMSVRLPIELVINYEGGLNNISLK